MPIVTVLVVLLVLGVALWALTTYVPLAPPIRSLIVAVVVIAALLFVLDAFGLLAPLRGVQLR